MIVKLLTEHYLEILSLNGGCRGSSESTHVKMPYCWKSNALAHLTHCLPEDKGNGLPILPWRQSSRLKMSCYAVVI